MKGTISWRYSDHFSNLLTSLIISMNAEFAKASTDHECTDILLFEGDAPTPDAYNFIIRTTNLGNMPQSSLQGSLVSITDAAIIESLNYAEETLEFENIKERQVRLGKRAPKVPKKKPPIERPHKLDKKIARIKEVLRTGSNSVSKIAKECRVSHGFAKWTSQAIMLNSNSLDKYFSSKRKDKIAKIEKAISDTLATNCFSTATDVKDCLKEKGIVASRSAIYRQFRRLGYYWKINQSRQLKPKALNDEDKDKIRTIAVHYADTLADDMNKLIFLDEMKFVKTQCPLKIWNKAKNVCLLRQNNCSLPDVLTAVVTCTTEQFVGIQFFCHELTAQDFAYHLARLRNKLEDQNFGPFRVVCDQAPWHCSRKILQSPLANNLVFNAPRHPQTNFIECCFSGPRNLYRSRKDVEDIETEVKEIMKIFMKTGTKEHFKNLTRNFVRTLRSVIKRF